ncbi:MAG: hypothetical protein Q7S51_09525 [Gallionellaceae bacterium]|nr:hypothetical protein [Gallionellaceae bacterium]
MISTCPAASTAELGCTVEVAGGCGDMAGAAWGGAGEMIGAGLSEVAQPLTLTYSAAADSKQI